MRRRTFLLLSALTPLLGKDFITLNQDINLDLNDLKLLEDIDKRLNRVQKLVGFTNFNIISFDETLHYARNYPKIGQFTKPEIKLIEKLFFTKPEKFGFYGDKTVQNITEKISLKDIEKVPYSGHFIFKGKPLEDYHRIVKDIGENIILTSGVRGVVKQLNLYLKKIKEFNGNISKASSIIAPPAYTYHAISDFDIGKKGWGRRNFTADFATTNEFKKIQKLNYVSIRYTPNNKDGVRFEPWHVKVIL